MIKTKMQRWIPSLMTAVALAGSASLCSAQSLISYTFDSSVQGFDGGGATAAWDATHGTGGGGCLSLTFDGTTIQAITPGINLAFNTSQYYTIEFDLNIDPSSGTVTSGWNTGSYGGINAVCQDASYNWAATWCGNIYSTGNNHYKAVISPAYGAKTRFFIQLVGSGPYSAPVTAYLDNVKIIPTPNPYILEAFTNDTSSSYGWANWSTTGSSTWNASQDAGGLTPAGSLQMDCAFSSGWQQTWFSHNFSWDPSRFTYLECDVKVDAANSTANGNGSYGYFGFNIRNSGWGDTATTPSGVSLDSSYTSWKHVKVALPNLSSSPAFDIKVYDTHAGPIRLYLDNIKFSNPVGKPTIAGLTAAGPSGTRIGVNGAGDQYNREAICIPAGTVSTVNYTWGGQTPATYSMTLTNFPSPAAAPGFEAHTYISSGDSGYDETYGAADWNSADMAILRVENGNAGGVVASFQWKTNSPNGNGTNTYQVNLPSLASANGTWSLDFSDDTHVALNGPSGVVTNVVLSADMAARFTSPSASFVQVGAFKNDGFNTGVNNNQGYVLSQVLVTNINGTIFNDNFSGGLTNNYAWRKSNVATITSIPAGTAYWLKWTAPDSGFSQQSTASLTGTWGDAGITYIYTDGTGTNRLGAVPTGALPAGSAAFFRLINNN